MTVYSNLAESASGTKRANTVPTEERTATWAELLLLLAVLEFVLWTDNKRVLPQPIRAAGTVLVAVVAAGLVVRQRSSRHELRLTPVSWRAGVGRLALAVALAGAALGAIGWRNGSLGNVERFGHWLAGNWLLDGAQQVLLQVLLVPRLTILVGAQGPRVSLTAAVVFSLLHIPNLPLMALTLLAAFVWCEWFRRYRNLPAVWASHVALAAMALYCLNGPALCRMRVGISYVLHSVAF